MKNTTKYYISFFGNPYDNKFNKKNQYSFKSKLIGTILFIIFILSIIGMIYFSSTKPSMSVFLFGTVFFLFGMYAAISNGIKDNLILLIFPITGAGTMLFSGIFTFGNLENKNFILRLLPFIILATLFLVGASLVVGKILINKYNKTHCTESVMAECIELKSSYDEGVTIYCPVFSFYYNDKMYEVCNNQYSNIGVPEINKEYEIFINPTNPDEYYINSYSNSFLVIFLGIIFMIVPTIITLMYLFSK